MHLKRQEKRFEVLQLPFFLVYVISLYIFWLCWVFTAAQGLSPVAQSGRLLSSCGDREGYSLDVRWGSLLSSCGDREGYSPVAEFGKATLQLRDEEVYSPAAEIGKATLQMWRSGRLLSSCGVQASPCRGLSCGQVWTPGHMDFSSCGGGACCPAACGIFWTQDGTCVPCISRRILNHLTAR